MGVEYLGPVRLMELARLDPQAPDMVVGEAHLLGLLEGPSGLSWVFSYDSESLP
jgi:hypothetical protein